MSSPSPIMRLTNPPKERNKRAKSHTICIYSYNQLFVIYLFIFCELRTKIHMNIVLQSINEV